MAWRGELGPRARRGERAWPKPEPGEGKLPPAPLPGPAVPSTGPAGDEGQGLRPPQCSPGRRGREGSPDGARGPVPSLSPARAGRAASHPLSRRRVLLAAPAAAGGAGRGGCSLVWLVGGCLDLSVFFCFVFCFVIFLCVFLSLPFAVQEGNGGPSHCNRNKGRACSGREATGRRGQGPRPQPRDSSLSPGSGPGPVRGGRGHGLWWERGAGWRSHRDGQRALLTAEGAEGGVG